MEIASAIIVLGLLIVVHEFGHFIVAKRLGVGVLKFSVGFGPVLFGRKIGETEYALSAIPLGGFVKMVGEEPGVESSSVDPRSSFSHQPIWRRLAIILAGPLANILFALVASVLLLWSYGVRVPDGTARIGEVMDGKPAAVAGVQNGDLVVAVDGAPVETWDQLAALIRGSGGREVKLTIKRGSETLVLPVVPQKMPDDPLQEGAQFAYRIGIMPSTRSEAIGFAQALREGTWQTWVWTKITVVSIIKLIQGQISRSDIGGPIFIVQKASEQARNGLENLVFFMFIISINLGVLNLLPIPVLDGGHVLFLAIEGLLRRPLDIRHREIAQQVGLAILLLLMAFAFYNDIARIVREWG